MRILVTGSRKWDDQELLFKALDTLNQTPSHDIALVHGACPDGADAMADLWGQMHGVEIETHPAKWKEFGKRAGYVRNALMVKMGADVCVAFIKDRSPGATMTANLAERSGITTIRIVA